MQEKMEKLIRKVYRKWKLGQSIPQDVHPEEEILACLIEGRLPEEEKTHIIDHLLRCEECSEAFVFNLRLKGSEAIDVPQSLIRRVKDLSRAESSQLLEIILRFKEKAIEIIGTTGDVLLGQEFVPAPILRSRHIEDFKDEVTILKDFKDIRVEVKIENKAQDSFNLIIFVKQKHTQRVIKDLRVTLLKGDTELESYLTETGAVKFEHVTLGKYSIEISSLENKLASIMLDVKV